MDELWTAFCKSGKISDYLKYRESVSDISISDEEMKNADNNVRNSNQRT
ncbi:MAG: hypothetical protein IKK32_02075 [Oscillospiraceae bacterium]|jgi:hypothetical protein|nr:hypothetical protein [Oscillospiraceae bacterium]MBR4092642.1 hypothetical protein [Oscillospiraceae bacterium]